MIKNKMVILSAISLLMALFSCGPSVVFDSTVQVPQDGWHKDTVAVFKSEITSLNESCHLLLQVNNSKSYPYSNIWLFVDAVFPSGNVQRDTIECTLANDAGDWFGKSNMSGDQFKSIHPYKLNIKFPEEGLYKYYLIQGMRDTVLSGISEVGIKIIEVE